MSSHISQSLHSMSTDRLSLAFAPNTNEVQIFYKLVEVELWIGERANESKIPSMFM